MSAAQNASYRSIRPAGEGERNPSPPSQQKRKITAVACLACQKKRCKCDGARPRCSACVAANIRIDCNYETRGDQSRSGALKERNQRLEEEVSRLKGLLKKARGGTSGTDLEVGGNTVVSGAPRHDMVEITPPFSAQSPSTTGNGTSPTSSSHDYARDTSPEAHSPSEIMRIDRAHGPGPYGGGGEDGLPSWSNKVRRLEAEVARLKTGIVHQSARTGGDKSIPTKESRSTQGNQHAPAATTNAGRLMIEPQLLPGPYNHLVGSSKFAIPRPLTDDIYNYVPTDPSIPLPQTAAHTFSSGNKRPHPGEQEEEPFRHKRSQRGDYLEIFGNLPFSSAILANYQPFGIQRAQVNTLHIPTHLVQMLNTEDHLSEIHSVLSPEYASSSFHSFRTYGRHLIAQGAPAEGVLGPPEIDVRPLFQTETYNSIIHTASTFAPWFLGAYPSMPLPAKVACSIMISTLLRWQISPTLEHYNAMPEWLRASGPQIFIPHTAAFDFIPWPRVRNYLISDGNHPEKEVIVAIMSNLQIDWPHSAEELFSWDYQMGVATGVSALFSAHMLDLNNWAINAKLLAKYPFLKGMARFLKVEAELEDVRGHN